MVNRMSRVMHFLKASYLSWFGDCPVGEEEYWRYKTTETPTRMATPATEPTAMPAIIPALLPLLKRCGRTFGCEDLSVVRT